MHDNGAVLRRLGLDLHATAREMATVPLADTAAESPQTRPDSQTSRRGPQEPNDTPDGWAQHHFETVWNARRLEHVPFHYSADAVAHWPGGREVVGPRAIGELIASLFASLPDAITRVEHVSWSEETDGVILAVRWTLEGTTRSGGLLGDLPARKPVVLPGASHFRFGKGHIVEEWTVFDELDALVQAYRE